MTLEKLLADQQWKPIDVRPLDDPLTSHCVLCGRLRYLADLELWSPELRVIQLRCLSSDCAEMEQPPVELIEEPDGSVRLDEGRVDNKQTDVDRFRRWLTRRRKS